MSEPFELRAEPVSGTTGRLYGVARPGRSLGPDCRVSDQVVRTWIDGLRTRLSADGALPQTGAVVYVCLLGSKHDSRREIGDFYNARGPDDPETAAVETWHDYLNRLAAGAMCFDLRHFPTEDHCHVPSDTMDAILRAVCTELAAERTVLVGCSAAKGRTREVFAKLKELEEARASTDSRK